MEEGCCIDDRDSSQSYIPRDPLGLLTTLKYGVLVMLCLQDIVLGQDLGPSYRNTARTCQTDAQCNSSIGEVCWWSYDGCPKGECKCDPRTKFLDASGKCQPVKVGDDYCKKGDKCPDGMTCQNRRCRCVIGVMTPDKLFCLRSNEKLLGERCSITKDVCFQKSIHGYTDRWAVCGSRGICQCEEGYQEDNRGCRLWNVGESGCVTDHNCQGGALCIDSVCKCPSNYITVAGNSKCAKIGAKLDLGVGSVCDEFNQRRYCGEGLVCHKCAGQTYYSCVRYIQATAKGLVNSATSKHHLPSIYIVAMAVFLVFSLRR